MVVTSRIPWKRLFEDLKWSLMIILIYNLAILYFDLYEHLIHFTIPVSLISIPGTVIGLLLAFRTNSAYDRWWEGRIIWGAIVNDSRTLARQLTTFTEYSNPNSKTNCLVRKIITRQIAWSYVLCRVLREQSPWAEMPEFLDKSEIAQLEKAKNIPNLLLQTSSEELRQIAESQVIDSFQYMQIDSTIGRLTDSLGKCERIKNTVFPVMYSRFLDVLIYFFIVLLPYSMVESSAHLLMPVSISFSIAFLAVDRIAFYLQDPFEDHASDVPMYAISRNIEINLKQQLGEADIPQSIEPVNGTLM